MWHGRRVIVKRSLCKRVTEKRGLAKFSISGGSTRKERLIILREAILTPVHKGKVKEW